MALGAITLYAPARDVTGVLWIAGAFAVLGSLSALTWTTLGTGIRRLLTDPVRLRWFSDASVDGLMKFATTFAIPALLCVGIATVDLGASADPAMLFSFYGGALTGFVVGMAGARLLFRRDWEDCVVVGFCGLFSNSVMLGLPVTERAYGDAVVVPGAVGQTFVLEA